MFTRQAVALPLNKRSFGKRRFIACDIENVVGGAVDTVEQAASAWAEIDQALAYSSGEQVVVGVCHRSLLATGLALPSARCVVKSGADGADLALIDVLLGENICERFSEVVLVTGDGIFADAVSRLEAEGARVTVVAREGHLSNRLRMAASSVIMLQDGYCELGDAA